LFGILNFGHCDLFGIYDLLFEILIAETQTPAFLTTGCQKKPGKGLT